MPKITPNLLNDTLNVVALAREMALTRGGQAQAERLTPVVDGLRDVVNTARALSQPPAPSAPTQPTGVLAGDDFQALLAASQAANPAAPTTTSAPTDRGQVAAAMAAGGMGEVDIARHLGATREEVRLMLSVSGPRGR